MTLPTLTVAMITHQRPPLLKRALESLRVAIRKSPVSLDFKILLNGQDPASNAMIESFISASPDLKISKFNLHQSVTPAQARNILCDEVASEWIAFLDDDILVPENLFQNFFSLQNQAPDVDVWGGPNLTPLDSDRASTLNGWVLCNPWIVGPVSKRYRLHHSTISRGHQFNLMLCNLIIRTNLFKKYYFVENLKTAEENELLARLKIQNCKMRVSDQLSVWHERRRDLKGLFRQIFYYGYGRGQVLSMGRLRTQWLFALYPFLYVLGCAALCAAPSWSVPLLFFWLISVQLQHRRNFSVWDLKVFFLPPLLWSLYTLGILKGLLVGLKVPHAILLSES